jgi:hypothetical protein
MKDVLESFVVGLGLVLTGIIFLILAIFNSIRKLLACVAYLILKGFRSFVKNELIDFIPTWNNFIDLVYSNERRSVYTLQRLRIIETQEEP